MKEGGRREKSKFSDVTTAVERRERRQWGELMERSSEQGSSLECARTVGDSKKPPFPSRKS